MLSFKCALEGPSIPFDAEEDEEFEYESHFAMKNNRATGNFIFNETSFF